MHQEIQKRCAEVSVSHEMLAHMLYFNTIQYGDGYWILQPDEPAWNVKVWSGLNLSTG